LVLSCPSSISLFPSHLLSLTLLCLDTDRRKSNAGVSLSSISPLAQLHFSLSLPPRTRLPPARSRACFRRKQPSSIGNCQSSTPSTRNAVAGTILFLRRQCFSLLLVGDRLHFRRNLGGQIWGAGVTLLFPGHGRF